MRQKLLNKISLYNKILADNKTKKGSIAYAHIEGIVYGLRKALDIIDKKEIIDKSVTCDTCIHNGIDLALIICNDCESMSNYQS